ncbi:hypothetical protein [Mucilaginibacter phyllosphaerae]|uniref:Uncharacterized protein n=1 Tax=Mucilaginibacter phyllosphaerae TaxID=1812349 RepID=A0A4Y8ABK8_9SPHI|nr:hypothetical protein [Mucilaginibacter phyllosphaerae]MBB3969290.1 hypothetical protein [Mucilaginibacter phyllosphaerae]TEW65913.1 hypothetical protein E2R65_12325 [Mucilaginibacter phyllosphaerae]GGH07459.1 hypothetical protein GCM10007352_12250 [Mucilaginibacter phyllosphaerae]
MDIPNEVYIKFYEAIKIKFLKTIPSEIRNQIADTDVNFWTQEIPDTKGDTYFFKAFGSITSAPRHFYTKYLNAVKDDKGFQREGDTLIWRLLVDFFGLAYPKELVEQSIDPKTKAKVMFQTFVEGYTPVLAFKYPELKIFDKLNGVFLDNGEVPLNDKVDILNLMEAENRPSSLKFSLEFRTGYLPKTPVLRKEWLRRYLEYSRDIKTSSFYTKDPSTLKAIQAFEDYIVKFLSHVEKQEWSVVKDFLCEVQPIDHEDHYPSFYRYFKTLARIREIHCWDFMFMEGFGECKVFIKGIRWEQNWLKQKKYKLFFTVCIIRVGLLEMPGHKILGISNVEPLFNNIDLKGWIDDEDEWDLFRAEKRRDDFESAD